GPRLWRTLQHIVRQAARGRRESEASWAPSREERAGARERRFHFRFTGRRPIRNLSPISEGLRLACSSRSWAVPVGRLPELKLICSSKRKIRRTRLMRWGNCLRRKNLEAEN